jgi:pyridoxamine 5'-phosphate oxidase
MDADELDPDPLVQLRVWLDEAARVVPLVGTVTLATATPDGRPSARQVLLRSLDERGLVFFTNRRSRKAVELAHNPRAALLFHWYELGRQVRVEGRVESASAEEEEAYWRTRPWESRLAAWASPQSQPLAGRDELERRYREAEARFGTGDVPLPPFWGGYRILPEAVEFWQHRANRLHDRILYVRSGPAWRRERLGP